MSRLVLKAVLISMLLGVPSVGASSFDASRWMNGADGLVLALERVKQDPRPLVVYFYTDWCGYCRQFEADLLGTEKMSRWLSAGLAVRINPESGDTERQIARYYGVQGYPGFFVHNPASGAFRKVQRMVVESGKPRLMSPDEFIAVLEAAAER